MAHVLNRGTVTAGKDGVVYFAIKVIMLCIDSLTPLNICQIHKFLLTMG